MIDSQRQQKQYFIISYVAYNVKYEGRIYTTLISLLYKEGKKIAEEIE